MSSLKERIQADLTEAMKAGKEQEVVKSTLRMALAAVMNAEVAGDEAVALSDDQVMAVLLAEAKKRAESAEIYEKAGRAEAAAKERSELAPKAMGLVVKAVRARAGAGVDGGKVASMVKSALGA